MAAEDAGQGPCGEQRDACDLGQGSERFSSRFDLLGELIAVSHQHCQMVSVSTHGCFQHFVQVMAKVNGGRTFFTTPETLGKYVLVDFIENRRKVIGRG